MTFEVTRDGQRLVCKRLTTRWLRDETAWARLHSEASLLAALGGRDAPALVESGDDGHGPYLVMKRAVWPALALTEAARDPSWVACAARATFEALARVHEARDARGPLAIVHGDLRPENLAVAPDGSAATLLDFGLAVWRDAIGAPDAGAFRGTLVYASPEAARGEPLGRRADLFALGASFLALAAGEPPRRAASEAALLALAAEEPLEPWARRAAARLAAPLAEALVACVAYPSADRPETAAQVAGRLAKPGA